MKIKEVYKRVIHIDSQNFDIHSENKVDNVLLVLTTVDTDIAKEVYKDFAVNYNDEGVLLVDDMFIGFLSDNGDKHIYVDYSLLMYKISKMCLQLKIKFSEISKYSVSEMKFDVYDDRIDVYLRDLKFSMKGDYVL